MCLHMCESFRGDAHRDVPLTLNLFCPDMCGMGGVRKTGWRTSGNSVSISAAIVVHSMSCGLEAKGCITGNCMRQFGSVTFGTSRLSHMYMHVRCRSARQAPTTPHATALSSTPSHPARPGLSILAPLAPISCTWLVQRSQHTPKRAAATLPREPQPKPRFCLPRARRRKEACTATASLRWGLPTGLKVRSSTASWLQHGSSGLPKMPSGEP